MVRFALKSAAIYLFWSRFRQEIVRVVISAIMIMFIVGIYNDLVDIFKDRDMPLIFLTALKWLLLPIIILYNIRYFKKALKLGKQPSKKVKEESVPTKIEQYPQIDVRLGQIIDKIKSKDRLRSRSEILLEKYSEIKKLQI